MPYISEWLPDPHGTDHGAEWVELGNDGTAPISLVGWSLQNNKGARTNLSGTIPPHGYFLLSANDLHLALRNADESLFLFDPSGNLADESHFFGVAPSGKSVNRSDAGIFFAVPTPGAPNATAGTALIASEYPQSGIISHSLSLGGAGGLLVGTALLLALCVTIAVTHHDDLREFFFRGDQEIR